MIIYKITNIKNNKVYIGQTIKTLEQRFNRHRQDAESGRLDTHFARAIRKYGIENFIPEIIEEVDSQENLNIRESFWIDKYNSCEEGYNKTNDMLKSGGNTYKYKTLEEMSIIKDKIRESKTGGKNPASRKVKCKNVISNQELHFNSMSEMKDFFKENNHTFISRRCRHLIQCLYKKEWSIAYEEDDYNENATSYKNNLNAKKVDLIDVETKELKHLPSFRETERYLELSKGTIKRWQEEKGNQFKYLNYIITIL